MDAQELRRFARQRLADYKLPEKILFLEQLPKGLTGKVHRLTEMLLARPELLDGEASEPHRHEEFYLDRLLTRAAQ